MNILSSANVFLRLRQQECDPKKRVATKMNTFFIYAKLINSAQEMVVYEIAF